MSAWYHHKSYQIGLAVILALSVFAVVGAFLVKSPVISSHPNIPVNDVEVDPIVVQTYGPFVSSSTGSCYTDNYANGQPLAVYCYVSTETTTYTLTVRTFDLISVHTETVTITK